MPRFRFLISLFVIFLPLLVTFSCGNSSGGSADYQPGMLNSTVSGRVIDQYGAGIEGVTVEAWTGTSPSGCQGQPESYTLPQTKETLTDPDGFYEFSEEGPEGLSGSAQIRPLGIWNGTWHTGFSFDPAARYISLSAGNDIALADFVGTPAYYVAGHITNSTGGVGDITVELSDGLSTLRETTSSSGYYYFFVSEGDYTVSPLIFGIFDPSSRDVTVYGDDVTGQDFFVSSFF